MFETKIKVHCLDETIGKKYPIYPARERYADLVDKFELDKKEVNKSTTSHPKRCPGIMDILSYGYIVQNWADLRFIVEDGKLLHVESAMRTLKNIEIWDSERMKKTNENSHWCGGYIKITSPWHIWTPPDTK